MAITQRCKTTIARERVRAEGRSSSDYLLISLPKFVFTALLTCVYLHSYGKGLGRIYSRNK